MKRFHVHVSVPSLDDAIRFYSALFAAEPTVRKPDYAKWMLDDPRVNFAISQRGAEPGVNHLGVQVETETELQEMQQRLDQLETGYTEQIGAACCYARSDKYWANDPVGIPWETYHTLDTIPLFNDAAADGGHTGDNCCVPTAVVMVTSPKRASSTCCGHGAVANNADETSAGCC